jgi:hypothetical protein
MEFINEIEILETASHLMNAPQIKLEEVGFWIPHCLLLTPNGEQLGEIKLTSSLRCLYMPLQTIMRSWVTLPFAAALYDRDGKKLGVVKRRGEIKPKLLFFNSNGEKIGTYTLDSWKGWANGKVIDANGEEIVYTESGNRYRDSYLEDVHGNHVASFKRSISPEENKKLFPAETVIIEFNKDRPEEEKLMFYMLWGTLWWLV